MEVRSVEAIVGALNGAGVRYLIVGGLAVNAHGYERLTVDVDLVIAFERQNIINGLRALESIDYHMSIPVTPEAFADPALRASWRAEKGMVVLKLWSDTHRRTPVDLFIYEPFDFERELGAARSEPILGDIKAPIVSLQTLLEMKREAGRPQDLADIADLLRIQELRREFRL
jgi:predicted nucleotidyltransferase